MPKFIPYNHDQHSMIVINFKDQLQPGTFEYAIHYLIHNKMDLSIFDDVYRNSENGRPAYDPAILLSIILFAYSKGITSSRKFSGVVKPILFLKPFPAIPFLISLPLQLLLAVSRKKLNCCLSKFS